MTGKHTDELGIQVLKIYRRVHFIAKPLRRRMKNLWPQYNKIVLYRSKHSEVAGVGHTLNWSCRVAASKFSQGTEWESCVHPENNSCNKRKGVIGFCPESYFDEWRVGYFKYRLAALPCCPFVCCHSCLNVT